MTCHQSCERLGRTPSERTAYHRTLKTGRDPWWSVALVIVGAVFLVISCGLTAFITIAGVMP